MARVNELNAVGLLMVLFVVFAPMTVAGVSEGPAAAERPSEPLAAGGGQLSAQATTFDVVNISDVDKQWISSRSVRRPVYRNGYVYAFNDTTVFKLYASNGTEIANNTQPSVLINDITVNDDWVWIINHNGLSKFYKSNLTRVNQSGTGWANGEAVTSNDTHVFGLDNGGGLRKAPESNMNNNQVQVIPNNQWSFALNASDDHLYYGRGSEGARRDLTLKNPETFPGIDNRLTLARYEDGYLYIAREEIKKIDVARNETVWSFNDFGGDPAWGIPRIGIDDRYVYVMRDNKLMKLKKSTGAPVGQINTSGGVSSHLIAHDDYLILSNRTDSYRINKSAFTPVGEAPSLQGERLELDVKRFMEHDSEQPYRVYYYNNSTGTLSVENVTGAASVTSNNTSIIVVDATAFELLSTQDTTLNDRVEITAEYTTDGKTYTTTENVTVANVTLENLKVLPGGQRAAAVANDGAMFFIIIGILTAIAFSRLASSFAGLSGLMLVIVVGWVAGNISDGLAMVAVFTAVFIGLNLAGNIDYAIRR